MWIQNSVQMINSFWEEVKYNYGGVDGSHNFAKI